MCRERKNSLSKTNTQAGGPTLTMLFSFDGSGLVVGGGGRGGRQDEVLQSVHSVLQHLHLLLQDLLVGLGRLHHDTKPLQPRRKT